MFAKVVNLAILLTEELCVANILLSQKLDKPNANHTRISQPQASSEPAQTYP